MKPYYKKYTMTTTALKIYEKWKEIQIGDYFHLIPWNCKINDNTYLVDGKIVHVGDLNDEQQ